MNRSLPRLDRPHNTGLCVIKTAMGRDPIILLDLLLRIGPDIVNWSRAFLSGTENFFLWTIPVLNV